ncbi:hypothetical protein FKM82_007565 [Ascaphus truei]
MSFPPTLSITDFEKTKNGTEHRTKDIWGKELILRRGQSFGVKLLFRCRGKDEKLENLNFTAQLVSCPSVANIQFPVSKLKDKKSWSAQVESGDHLSALSITICSPASAYIGRYSLCLHGMYGGTSQTFSLGDIILLFNPWCPDDDVFLDNEKLRQEYVMNEHGFMYTGNKDCIQSMPWNFGQFEDGVGDICLKILDMSPQFLNDPSTDCSKRGDPVYISRIISAMINSNDDRGVVESCWEEFFRNGANPSTWNGSVTILRLWKKSGCRAVRYGQCWVLAGVMCTVFRFLGIPTRVVTNFESAHDSNCNLTVDEYYDETGRKLKAAAGDSVWNFHVWDECWMARKDLRPGYDGWQVLDATPQELSGGTYCCGPASVKAVKEGDLEVPYDVPFVYAEVNGDSIHWLLREEGVEKLKIDTGAIGKHISTKSVGTNDRDDITDLYKYREGSYQERSIFEKAASKMNTGHPNTSRVPEVSRDYDVFLNLEDSPLVGKTINLLFRVCNKTFEAKTFSVNASAQVMQYNGTPLDQFWKESYDMQVNANSATDKTFRLTPRVPPIREVRQQHPCHGAGHRYEEQED